MRNRIILAVLIAIAVVLPMYLRSLFEAQAHFQAAISETQVDQRIQELRKAISWDAPFNSASRQAQTTLENIALDKTQPDQIRLEAFRELLRGLRSSRSILNPHEKDGSDAKIDLIEHEISELTKNQTSAQNIVNQTEARSNYSAQIAAQLMFWAWVLAAIWTIFKGFAADGTIRAPQLKTGLSFVFVFYLLWLVSLKFA